MFFHWKSTDVYPNEYTKREELVVSISMNNRHGISFTSDSALAVHILVTVITGQSIYIHIYMWICYYNAASGKFVALQLLGYNSNKPPSPIDSFTPGPCGVLRSGTLHTRTLRRIPFWNPSRQALRSTPFWTPSHRDLAEYSVLEPFTPGPCGVLRSGLLHARTLRSTPFWNPSHRDLAEYSVLDSFTPGPCGVFRSGTLHARPSGVLRSGPLHTGTLRSTPFWNPSHQDLAEYSVLDSFTPGPCGVLRSGPLHTRTLRSTPFWNPSHQDLAEYSVLDSFTPGPCGVFRSGTLHARPSGVLRSGPLHTGTLRSTPFWNPSHQDLAEYSVLDSFTPGPCGVLRSGTIHYCSIIIPGVYFLRQPG